MNWGDAILWGFVATIVLTTLLSGSRSLGFTRMDIPFMLGTMFTENRDRAVLYGFLLHMLNGWFFAVIYIAALQRAGLVNIWFGAMAGGVHALFLLTAGMSILPAVHPRMATEHSGPTPTRVLEPPGFLALNYGRRTPLASIFAHLVFGAILGYFYRP
jgi:hypothetical protein